MTRTALWTALVTCLIVIITMITIGPANAHDTEERLRLRIRIDDGDLLLIGKNVGEHPVTVEWRRIVIPGYHPNAALTWHVGEHSVGAIVLEPGEKMRQRFSGVVHLGYEGDEVTITPDTFANAVLPDGQYKFQVQTSERKWTRRFVITDGELSDRLSLEAMAALVEKHFPEAWRAEALDVAWCESRYKPKAQNPTSSAGGLFQFLDSTWQRFGKGAKYDANQNAKAAAALVQHYVNEGHWRWAAWSCQP